MKLRNFLVAVFFSTSLISSLSHAEVYQDIQQLRGKIESYTNAHYLRVYGESVFRNNVEISVGNLDSRLRLSKCDDNLTFKISEPPHRSKNITVRVRCSNNRRWAIYVPVTVDVFSDVLVASQSLGRGTILSQKNLSMKRMNVAKTGQGYLEDPTRVVGLELKRSLNSGDPIHLAHLQEPLVVKRGDSVTLTARSSFLRVTAPGTALASGQKGKQIRVRNNKSLRVVEAYVMGPGAVQTRRW